MNYIENYIFLLWDRLHSTAKLSPFYNSPEYYELDRRYSSMWHSQRISELLQKFLFFS